MAIARMTGISNEVRCIDVKTSVSDLKAYLKNLRGTKILTFEETNTSQWLYTELRPYVDELIVCDPYRNRLLSEGAKNDKIDAVKQVRLLKGGLIKPVFHIGDEIIELRKLVSGYDDLIRAGVRAKNQRSALERSIGGDLSILKEVDTAYFVMQGLDRTIAAYEEERKRYETEFHRQSKCFKEIGRLQSIPGIGLIGAIKTLAIVVDARRFANRRRFWAYCGLVYHDRMSGGKSYGQKMPRFSRPLKCVFKTAALATISGPSIFGEDYRRRVREGQPEYQARHAIARGIAAAALGVLSSGKKFKPTAKEERRLSLQNKS
jgi:transposase